MHPLHGEALLSKMQPCDNTALRTAPAPPATATQRLSTHIRQSHLPDQPVLLPLFAITPGRPMRRWCPLTAFFGCCFVDWLRPLAGCHITTPVLHFLSPLTPTCLNHLHPPNVADRLESNLPRHLQPVASATPAVTCHLTTSLTRKLPISALPQSLPSFCIDSPFTTSSRSTGQLHHECFVVAATASLPSPPRKSSPVSSTIRCVRFSAEPVPSAADLGKKKKTPCPHCCCRTLMSP
jgi:hypothetical protein